MNSEMMLVLDFGGQYNQLIARRVRECNVYCEVHPYTLDLEKIRQMNPKGIIFTGGPNSVYLEESPHIAKEIFEMNIPILGICFHDLLDEPYGLYFPSAGGIPHHCPHYGLPSRSDGMCRETFIRGAVPS